MGYLGAIEAGGTKFVCCVGTESGEIVEKRTFPTLTPDETIGEVVSFFGRYELDAIGIGSFGPVDLNKTSKTYGFITTTPKEHWRQFNFVGKMREHFPVPIGFSTDVNAALLGEVTWGQGKGYDSCTYMTVGTGIGVGATVAGQLLHGFQHPEAGHIPVKRHPDDTFSGNCPYHADCLEGMAAGPAIAARWGSKAEQLETEESVWELEAYYLAQALVNQILLLSPSKLIIGGGVMKAKQLLPLIRKNVVQMLNGYIQHENVLSSIDEYIALPGLGDEAGIYGALVLATQAYQENIGNNG